MLIPLLAWGIVAGVATFGGMVYASERSKRLQAGDIAYVPFQSLRLDLPGSGISPQSLVGLGGQEVKVNVLGVLNEKAFGAAGKDIGLTVPVNFDVKKATYVERGGLKYVNPQRAG